MSKLYHLLSQWKRLISFTIIALSRCSPENQSTQGLSNTFLIEIPIKAKIGSQHYNASAASTGKNPIPQSEKWGHVSASLWCSLLFIQIGHVHQRVLVVNGK